MRLSPVSARTGRFGLGPASTKSKAAGAVIACASLFLAGCGGSASSATPAPETMASASSSAAVPLAGLTSTQPSSVPSSPASGSPEGLEPAGIETKGDVVGSDLVVVVGSDLIADKDSIVILPAVDLTGCRLVNHLGSVCGKLSDEDEARDTAEQEAFAAMLGDLIGRYRDPAAQLTP